MSRNPECQRRCELVMRERQTDRLDVAAFTAGFHAGWEERGIAEPGMVTITREHLRELEQRAGVTRSETVRRVQRGEVDGEGTVMCPMCGPAPCRHIP